MYNKAHEFVNLMGENKEDILKLKIVLGMVVGKPYSKEKFKLELEKIKMSSKLMPDFDRL